MPDAHQHAHSLERFANSVCMYQLRFDKVHILSIECRVVLLRCFWICAWPHIHLDAYTRITLHLDAYAYPTLSRAHMCALQTPYTPTYTINTHTHTYTYVRIYTH